MELTHLFEVFQGNTVSLIDRSTDGTDTLTAHLRSATAADIAATRTEEIAADGEDDISNEQRISDVI